MLLAHDMLLSFSGAPMRLTYASLVPALLLALLFLAVPRPAVAQVTAADSASILMGAAGRFEADGRSDVALELYRYIAAHFPDTAAGLRAQGFLTGVRDEGTTGDGRVQLQVFGTLYGLWLGVAVPGAFGADAPEAYGAGLLVGGPVGFLAGRALARKRPFTEAQARAITLGAIFGTWQGVGWANVLDLGETTTCIEDSVQPPGTFGPSGPFCYQSGDPSEERFASAIVGGVAGIVAGSVLSRQSISPGEITTVNFGALWGTWLGFATGYIADAHDDALLSAALIGGDVGLLATALGAPHWNPSRSRARLVSIYGVIGALSGLGVDLLTQPDDDRVTVGVPLAGSVLGLALGVRLTRSYAGRLEGPPPPDGALFGLADGAWSMDAPLPYPVMVERPGPRGIQRKAALAVTLLSAKF